jgi:hypothetical protein
LGDDKSISFCFKFMPPKIKFSARVEPKQGKKSSGDSDDDDEEEEKKDTDEDNVDPPEENDPEVAALAAVLFKTDLGYKLEGVQKIYHVSGSQQAMNNIIANGFQVYAADDANFDGLLASDGAPLGIFFCSTLYNGYLPTITMYPRPPFGHSLKGNKYPRVAIDLKSMDVHANYKLYLVKDPTTPSNQVKPTLHVHIAMIHIQNVDAIAWAVGKLQPLGLTNTIFTYDDGFWFAPRLQQPGGANVWTNIFLVPAPGERLQGPLETAEFAAISHF